MDQEKCADDKTSKVKTIIGNCLVCNKEFKIPPSKQDDPNRGKYCSRKCSDLGRRKGKFKKCLVCGSEFWEFASRPQNCCSAECRSKNFSGERHPKYKEKVLLVCNYCNIEYFVNEFKSKSSKYCSEECLHKSMIGKYIGEKSPRYNSVIKECPVCNKKFKLKKSQDEKSLDNCCCREHAIEWSVISGKYAGENNGQYGKTGELSPSWNGGTSFEPYSPDFNKQLKIKIKKRDQGYCQICGNKFRFEQLDVHHADYDKWNNKEENLFSLCKSCHGKTLRNRECWKGYFDVLSSAH